jgi:D-alanyl-D-alanine carboxypeptidase/D-alanyl-D-alanine-endopeptidase (penicillin-binding protein 4)
MRRTFRTVVAAALGAALLLPGLSLGAPSAAAALPAWASSIEKLIGTKSMSVAVGDGGTFLYRHDPATARPPASVQKLLMAMPLLAALGPSATIPTDAAGNLRSDGSVGNLWVIGGGDPRTGPGPMRALAQALVDAGVTKVTGRILGDTATFSRDWWAIGWKTNFPDDEIALPTALTFRRNRLSNGTPITDPELRAAGALTTALENLGVDVVGAPSSGSAPTDLPVIASVQSRPVSFLLAKILGLSDNFGAEVLGKTLAFASGIRPATISAGAGVAKTYAADLGVTVSAYDSSGLSSSNRLTAAGLVALLADAEMQPWGLAFQDALPMGGEGTLANRLSDVRVHAKTGTIDGVSALAGWVWSSTNGTWLEFVILSQGLAKTTAVSIEDQIVRILAESA